MTSQNIVHAASTDPLPVRRLTAARESLAAAVEREEHICGVVASRGGLERCSDRLVTQRVRASALVCFAQIDVERWEQRATEASA